MERAKEDYWGQLRNSDLRAESLNLPEVSSPRSISEGGAVVEGEDNETSEALRENHRVPPWFGWGLQPLGMRRFRQGRRKDPITFRSALLRVAWCTLWFLSSSLLGHHPYSALQERLIPPRAIAGVV